MIVWFLSSLSPVLLHWCENQRKEGSLCFTLLIETEGLIVAKGCAMPPWAAAGSACALCAADCVHCEVSLLKAGLQSLKGKD